MRCLVPLLLALLFYPVTGEAQRRPAGENITYGYAQVTRVAPVYEMVRSRVPRERCQEVDGKMRCDTVQVESEERRLAGFDVEYLFKGETYMSRLDRDPGSRLRVRVSVMPDDNARVSR